AMWRHVTGRHGPSCSAAGQTASLARVRGVALARRRVPETVLVGQVEEPAAAIRLEVAYDAVAPLDLGRPVNAAEKPARAAVAAMPRLHDLQGVFLVVGVCRYGRGYGVEVGRHGR